MDLSCAVWNNQGVKIRLYGRAAGLLATCLAAACADEASTSSGPDAAAPGGQDAGGRSADAGDVQAILRLDPARVSLVDTATGAARQTFVVRAVLPNGMSADRTAQASFRLEDPELGTLDGATFVTRGRAGATRLVAELDGLRATAEIEVRVTRTVDATEGPALPADPGGIFARAPVDASREAPSLVYPNGGTVLPPNLAGLELHFRRGADDELFRIRLEGGGVRLEVYTRCRALGGGCLYALPEALWSTLAASAAGRGPVEVTVEGVDDGGRGRALSAPLELSIAARPVEGGLYYWSTSEEAILRVDFGAQGAPEQFWPPPGTRGGPCYGCHALSPDGQRMTLSENGQWDGKLTLLDVASRAPLVRASDAIREQFQSWAPDSERFAAVYGDDDPPSTELRIRDGETGQIETAVELGFEASHVDWSPAGDRIAMTRVTRHYTSQRPGRGGIAYIERQGGGWSGPSDLVPPRDGLNHFTPAYAPSGDFLVFARSRCAEGEIYQSRCDGDADPTARLFAISSEGGALIPLDNVNAPGVEDATDDLTNTFPKWAPFVDAARADGTGRLMWLTFSSRRRYGLRPRVGSNQLLWMVAVDPDAIEAGRDGSFAPFALPFQDLSTSNHIAQWTRRVVPTEPPDAGTPDGGACLLRGEDCDPAASRCCAGLACIQGPAGTPVCDRRQ